MPPPPQPGTDNESARGDAGDDALGGATGTEADKPPPPADYVDPEFAKALAARKARKPTSDPRLPPVGTVIIKKDRQGNERCRCTVVETGIQYEDAIYKSISAAAMAAAKDLGMASKSQDGYAFWQLKKAALRAGGSAKKDPPTALQNTWARYHERAAVAAAKVDGDAERARIHAALSEHLVSLRALTDGRVGPSRSRRRGSQGGCQV